MTIKIGIPVAESKTQYYINKAYVDYVHEADMKAVMIMPGHNFEETVKLLDGIVLPGGIDVDPIYYGEDNYTSYTCDPEKDSFERGLFHTFRKANKPIFGICRGFQLIALEYMNAMPKMRDFVEFCTNIGNHNQVRDQELSRNIFQHYVDTLPYLLYNETEQDMTNVKCIPVNSMHHQCLLTNFMEKNIIGVEGFRMAAWTSRGIKQKKGKKVVVCEAFNIFNWGAPILAVQWHPEELKDLQLIFNFFSKHCTKKGGKPYASLEH